MPSNTFSRCLPHGVHTELKEMFKISWPSVLYQMLWFLTMAISMAFCGHLGRDVLDAAALAVMTANIIGHSLLAGLSTACDTLFSQVYGSKNKKYVGIVLQRCLFLLVICCFPISAFFINAELILRLLRQPPVTSRLAGIYLKTFTLSLPAYAVSETITRYLQAQSIVKPSLVIGVLANLISVILNSVFMYWWKLGITGASLALTLSNWSVALLHISYIIIWKVYKDTWPGFSWEWLQDWGQFFSLALPGMAMMCLEWWAMEVITFFSGWLGGTELAAYVIADGFLTIAFSLATGISVAVSVRVGNFLGSGDPGRARTSSRSGLLIICFTSVIVITINLCFHKVFPFVYTSDRAVVNLTSRLLLQMCFNIFTDALQCVLSGVIRGAGHQTFGAVTNLFAYYVICLPVAIYLMFKTEMGIAGAYWALAISNAFQSTIYLIKVFTMNWTKESVKAQERAGMEATNNDGNVATTTFSSTNASDSKTVVELSDGQSVVYSRVASEEDLDSIENFNMQLDDNSKPDDKLMNLSDTSDESSPSDSQTDSKFRIAKRCKLSVKQLVFRRGLFIFGCALVFVAGIVVDMYFDQLIIIHANETLSSNVTDLVKNNLSSSATSELTKL